MARSNSYEICQLRKKLRILSQLHGQSWRNGPGRLVGALPYLEAEACFSPGAIANSLRHSAVPFNGSGSRIFQGGGWGEVLAIAHFDLPGRVCGFLFVGRDGRTSDRVFKSTYRLTSTQRPEGGLAGLETVERSNGEFGHDVLAVADPLLAVRLQVRHAISHTRPLPMVAWCDQPQALTKYAWRTLSDKKVVVWAWRLTAAVVYQAMRANSHLCLLGPEDLRRDSVDHYIRLLSPDQLFRRVVRNARPWREAVRVWRAHKGMEPSLT